MHTSRKASRKASSIYDGDFSLCDIVLTRHAQRRCKERHIKPTRVRDANAIIKGRYVVTVWQKPPERYGVHCTRGIDYLRKTNRNKVIPNEVLMHMKEHTYKEPEMPEIPKRKPRKPRKRKPRKRKPRKPKKHGVSRSRRGV